MKQCTTCGRRRPLDDFRRYVGRSPDGRRPLCKDCQRAYEVGWRRAHREHLRQARQRRTEKARAYVQRYNLAHRGEILVKEAIRRARRRGLPCDLRAHAAALIRRVHAGRCELTGLPLNLGRRTVSWDSPSLDRIVPALGYTMTNVRVVCFAMNAALGSWGEAQLRTIMSAWLGRR